MSYLEFKVVKEYIYLYERSPDPAGGRADEKQIARFTVDYAESFIREFKCHIIEAQKAQRKKDEEELGAVLVRMKELKKEEARLKSRLKVLRGMDKPISKGLTNAR